MTLASAESETRSFKSVPGGMPHESEKALPLPPFAIPSGSWLKPKVLRRSHSTTTSEDEKGRHLVNDSGDELAGTEQSAFGWSRWKQVQMGKRISGASVDSLVVEKQEV